MKNIFKAALLINLSLLAACGHKPQQFHEVKENNASKINTAIIQDGYLNSAIQIPGEIVAYQQVDIYAKVTSFVKKFYVDLGDHVTQGQLLVTLEAPEMTSQLASAEQQLNAQMAIATASASTYKRLLETSKTPGTVSQNDLSIALAKQNSDKAQLSSAKAVYQQIAQTRGYLNISAPFSGVISARNVSQGAYVGPSGKGSVLPLFTLQQQDHLRLNVMVPEAYSSYLKVGDQVTFTVKAMPDKKFTAKVNRLAGALDPTLRTQQVQMDVYNADHQLLPGMAAQVDIQVGQNNKVLKVPSTAVLETTTMFNTVIVKKNGNAHWVKITKGRTADGFTEIFGDLQAGDTVITNPTEEIRDGSKL